VRRPGGWRVGVVAGLVGGAAEPVAQRRARPGPCPGRRPPGAVLGGGVGQEPPDRRDGGAVQVVVAVTTQPVQRTSDLDRWSDQGAAGPDDHDLVAVRVQRPAAVAAAGRAGRGAQRDLTGTGGRPRGGDQDVGDRGRLVAVAAKPPGLVVGSPWRASWKQLAAARCARVGVWLGCWLGAALGHERGFSDLADRLLLVAVLDPACAAAGAEGDRVQTEGDGDKGRSAQRAAWHEILPGRLLWLALAGFTDEWQARRCSRC
jgi:hypothetical protein